jgi:hypothetical protein
MIASRASYIFVLRSSESVCTVVVPEMCGWKDKCAVSLLNNAEASRTAARVAKVEPRRMPADGVSSLTPRDFFVGSKS